MMRATRGETRAEVARRIGRVAAHGGAASVPSSGLGRLLRTGGAIARGGLWSLRRALGGNGNLDLDRLTSMVAGLGRLKGVSMKVGQMLSYVDVALPAEMRDALAALQTHAPPMPTDVVRKIVRDELGERGRALAETLSPEPVAAASIGQVHRATLPDGRAVAVKVLYPGIEQAIAGDFGPAAVGARLASIVYPGATSTAIGAFVSEARARFLEECDYGLEAARQARFAEIYAEHATIVVPAVHRDYSARRVLTTTFVEGLHLDGYLAGLPDASARNRTGEALFEFYLGSLFRYGLYNCDPHPGNYLFLADGRIAMLDFGCTREFDATFVGKLAALTRAVHADDPALVERAVTGLGMLRPGREYDPDAIRSLVRAFYGPMLVDDSVAFEIGDALRMREVLGHKRALSRIALPGEFLFLLRIRFGLASVLAQIGARANWHRLEAGYVEDCPFSAEPRFDVVLVDPGADMVVVMREIREATGLPLAEIKALVDARPRAVKHGLARADAEILQRALLGAGASVELRRSGAGAARGQH